MHPLLENTQSFIIGEPFIELTTVNSTNSYAIEQWQANLAAYGTAYFAYEQTAGRGQRAKTWVTQPNSNIIISLVVPSQPLLLHQQFMLSVVAALACQQFFNTYTKGNTTIKWPNDIYWNDRKAAGILIENLVKGNQWQTSVIGIGMNINQTVFENTQNTPVSLQQITGKSFPVVTMAKELCSLLNQYWQQLVTGNFNGLLALYNQHLYKQNQAVKLKQGSRVFEATIKEVNNYGQLVVHTNTEELFNFGEVEWML